MCGIAGYIARRGRAVDRDRLAAMCAAVSHRGPDGTGLTITGSVGLGHRRLSIFDLSADGAQPMFDPQSGRSIIFNGAIYNYLELRADLANKGRRFYTGTDTEVILAAYDTWGSDCVNHFNGMWAFAIHDPQAGIVFCSRDRFGIKPFYYVETADCFAFGSEIRQLLPLLPAVRVCEEVLIDFIFTDRCEHREDTFFDSVRKLPAGCNLTYRLDQDRHFQQRYYRLERRTDLEKISLDDAIALYKDGLEDAVRLRLRSDAPIGTCLSGGLDSSSVASLAASLYNKPDGLAFAAVTAVSEDPTNDESSYARSVANNAGLRWLTTKPDYTAFESSIEEVVEAQEEPFAGPSICMQYFVMRTARESGLKVLLDGQGGDETLLGYERYFAAHYLAMRRRHGWRAMISSMHSSARHNARMSPPIIAGYLAYFSTPRVRFWQYKRRHQYLKQSPGLPDHLIRYAQASRDEFELQRLEIETTNLPALLRYEDKNAMWHGIETRLPFLDYRLVETALALPGEYKVREGWTKYVLRRGMSGILQDDIAWRRDKRGFEAPESVWLARHSTRMESAVKNSRVLASVCDISRLQTTYSSLDSGTQWRLYSIALWEECFNVSA